MARAVTLEENEYLERAPGIGRGVFMEVEMVNERPVKGKSEKRAGEDRRIPSPKHRLGREEGPIRFAAARTDLGWVLVAGTGRGLCAIRLGDSREAVIDSFKARFAKGEHLEGDPESVRWLRGVTESIASPRRGVSLPLDIRGTAFQRRVWRELQRIPIGRTASYGEVARRIGMPGAARAVARACASNPLPLAVPCHRVIRSNGDLGGYGGGIERKRALLEREAGSSSANSGKGSA